VTIAMASHHCRVAPAIRGSTVAAMYNARPGRHLRTSCENARSLVWQVEANPPVWFRDSSRPAERSRRVGCKPPVNRSS
jgi:hypothetical protein